MFQPNSSLSPAVLKAFESVPDLYLILSPTLVVLTASNAYLTATFTARESMVGKYLFAIFPDNGSDVKAYTLNNLRASLGQVLATKKPHRMDVQRYDLPQPTATSSKFISKYWLPLNTPVLDDQGEVLYIIHKVEDVTEMVETRQSEQQFRLMANSVPQIIWLTDAEGHNEFFNQQWSDYTGAAYEPSTAAQVAVDYVHPDDGAATMAAFNEARATGKAFRVEHRIRSKAGDYRWFLVRAEPYRDATTGEIIRWFGVSVDIHDHKQAEKALRVAEEQYRIQLKQEVAQRTGELKQSTELLQSVFDTTLISMSVLKAVRDENGEIIDFKIQLANKELQRETNRPDLAGKYYGQEFPGIKKVGLFDLMRQVMASGEPAGKEYYYPYEGLEKWYSSMCVKLDDGLVVTTLDITLRQQAEQELIKNNLLLRQAEQETAEKNLHLRLEQQKALLVAILDAQEEERRRISESLHNGVGQLLYATKLNLDQVRKLVPPVVIKSTEKLLAEAIQETRRVSQELVPILLHDFGLVPAFQDLCSKYNTSTLEVNCEIEGLEERLESYLEVALYRICQELLTNVVKHAQATKADILLVREDGEITLKVRDNGIHISPLPGQKRGIGLRAIADRVKLLNGIFSITTPASSKGTLALIRIPV